MRSYFPDVNVWIALAYEGHQHHLAAAAWFAGVHTETIYFCRLTQIGFLRLLTHPRVMQDEVRHQGAAWRLYDQFRLDPRIEFCPEPDPEQLEENFRGLTSASRSSSRQWPDAYLAAFALVGDLTLVTFDRGLRQMAKENALLLD
jgi:toxin-antitoxin system PIN domain toxin